MIKKISYFKYLSMSGLVGFWLLILSFSSPCFAHSGFGVEISLQDQRASFQLLGQPTDVDLAEKLIVELKELLPSYSLVEKLPRRFVVWVDPDLQLSDGYFEAGKEVGKLPTLFLSRSRLALSASLLAHELTHMVQAIYRPKEENWLKEAHALLIQKVSTKITPVQIGLVPRFPEVSLINSFDYHLRADKNRLGPILSAYGHAYLYLEFLYRNCAGQGFLDLLLSKSDKTGVEFINEILQKAPVDSLACQDFESSFFLFQLAKFYPAVRPGWRYLDLVDIPSPLQSRKADLPAYAAQVFYIEDPSECSMGSLLPENRCLEVQSHPGRWLRSQIP